MDPTLAMRMGSPTPPTSIQSTSPFSPHKHQCCQCNTTSSQCTCAHAVCASCPTTDLLNNPIIPHSFPADWVCATCNTTHSVLSILTRNVSCPCGAPRLQAVYDQFGRIFLFWRDDPAVEDLRDPKKVQEAAWRIWEAGGEPWEEEVERWEAKRWGSGESDSGSEEEGKVEGR